MPSAPPCACRGSERARSAGWTKHSRQRGSTASARSGRYPILGPQKRPNRWKQTARYRCSRAMSAAARRIFPRPKRHSPRAHTAARIIPRPAQTRQERTARSRACELDPAAQAVIDQLVVDEFTAVVDVQGAEAEGQAEPNAPDRLYYASALPTSSFIFTVKDVHFGFSPHPSDRLAIS